ncbi:DEAD box family helicase [Coprinopsis marcescibilis]|uniref:DEAD box family helicase n=1 Tax=Coprinopsis marcescibilis TaxID=230819 RepID=A0A5C3LB84_COPMA|nr:DEAD box family helicase [Coprinopsis marcescibilis]
MLGSRCRTVSQGFFGIHRRSRFLSTEATQVILRPYQEHCINSCLETLENGVSRIGVSLPTGSGKTTVFVTLVSRLRATNEGGSQALVIVNSIELARQAAATAKHLFPEWTVEIEQGAKHTASGLADLTVATYQTLLNPLRLEKFQPKNFKAIIVDEAHHAAAPSYRKLLSIFHQDVRPNSNEEDNPTHSHSVPIIGFSATFGRHDSLALGSVFEQIVYHRDFLEMIDEQWLCAMRLTSVHAKLELDEVAVSGQTGDFRAKNLASVMNTPTTNDLTVRVWLERVAPTRKSTLVFCVNIDHVKQLTKVFRNIGVDARHIHSLTPSQERKELIRGFKAGEYPVLINCAILTEGADIPNIDCVLLARPTRSRNVFMQMIGRGMRLSPSTGKEDCLIVDFVDSTSRVPNVMSVPTLLGLDTYAMNLENTKLEDLKAEAPILSDLLAASLESASARVQSEFDEDENEEDELVVKEDNKDQRLSVTFLDHEDVSGIFGLKKGQSYRRASPYAWVRCRDDLYILEAFGRAIHVKLVNKDLYVGYCVVRDRPTREVLRAHSLEDALRAADNYVEKLVGFSVAPQLLRFAGWRKNPASRSQIEVIKNRFHKSGGESGTASGNAFKSLVASSLTKQRTFDEITLDVIHNLTKGEAAIVLCKLMNGGIRSQVAFHKTADKARKAIQKRFDSLQVKPPLFHPSSHPNSGSTV